ncbi:hypothetical protein V9T40_012658 [Parthenolecanium corni]|uniref:Uncharacterized protein n=1 Tax=Parthenolecanium corni TaxID=536013 RepID=A0AAN9TKT2_9HEMI
MLKNIKMGKRKYTQKLEYCLCPVKDTIVFGPTDSDADSDRDESISPFPGSDTSDLEEEEDLPEGQNRSPKSPKKKTLRKKRHPIEKKDKTSKSGEIVDDQFSKFGCYVGEKLRKIDPSKSAILMDQINCLILQAETERNQLLEKRTFQQPLSKSQYFLHLCSYPLKKTKENLTIIWVACSDAFRDLGECLQKAIVSASQVQQNGNDSGADKDDCFSNKERRRLWRKKKDFCDFGDDKKKDDGCSCEEEKDDCDCGEEKDDFDCGEEKEDDGCNCEEEKDDCDWGDEKDDGCNCDEEKDDGCNCDEEKDDGCNCEEEKDDCDFGGDDFSCDKKKKNNGCGCENDDNC